jgi:DNA mismatch endonuclease (patch repair protein)
MDSKLPDLRSENMRRIRSRDTIPEIRVRQLVHAMGYRFRLHKHDLPGRPDLVFNSLKKVIFVHGCFWHAHRRCKLSRVPKSNTDYWIPKLRRNTIRDAIVRKLLRRAGWEALVIWECKTCDPLFLRATITRFLDSVPCRPKKPCLPRHRSHMETTRSQRRAK